MLIRDRVIEITKDNIDEINYDDVIVITVATGPAQGEPNGVMIVTKDLKVFHTNKLVYYGPKKAKLWGITPNQIVPIKEFVKKLPLFNKIGTNGLQFFNQDKDWEMIYMDYGNYLFIRKERADKFLKLVDSYEGRNRIWWPYCYWYDMLSECLGNESKHKAPAMDIFGILGWARYKKNNGIVPNKNFNLIDENEERDVYEFKERGKKPK